MKFESPFSKLREAAIRAAPASGGGGREERRDSLRDLLRWLLLLPLILLLLFGSSTLGMFGLRPAQADTRSLLSADYHPWPFTVFMPVDPEIIEEVQEDQILYPSSFDLPVEPTIVTADFWVTATPTPSPTPTIATTSTITSTPTVSTTAGTPTPTSTTTSTPTASPSASPTPTFTPSGPPSPIPPAIPPANTYWFYDDTLPLAHMMYTTLPNGNYRSGGSVSFYSPTFLSGQSLYAGTTSVNFYGWNPSPSASLFSAELLAGGTSLGSGSFALPGNTYDAYLFSASFPTGSHNFADGERLEVRFNFSAPAEIYWDDGYNYSGASVPSVATTPTPTATVSPTPTNTLPPTATPTPTLVSAAVTVDSVSQTEGGDLIFTISLDNAVGGGFNVDVTFTDGSATGGTDYDNTLQTVPFAGTAGETQQFTVTTTDDAVLEGSETFTVGLNATDPLVTDTDTGTGTITDNDTATITVDNVSQTEGGNLVFTISLDNAVQGGFNVDVTFTDGSATGGPDYDNILQTVVFTGTAAETRQFTVSSTDDAVLEGSETFTVNLNSTNTSVTDSDTGTGTLTDNDGAQVTVNSVSGAEGVGLTFTVTLDNPVASAFQVNVTLSDASATGGAAPLAYPEDYDNVVAALNFAGNAGETQQFTVATLDDPVLEGGETFNVSLNATDPLVVDTDTGVGTITDNDTAEVTVNSVTMAEGSGLTFTVTLDNAVAGAFDADVTFSDASATGGPAPLSSGEDYANDPITLNFVGNAGETQQFTVNTFDDAFVEGTETFTVIQSSTNPSVTDTDTGTGIITDNDSVNISIDDVTLAEGNAGPTTFTFTVSIDQADPTNPVTVNWDTVDGTATTADSDYLLGSGSLTFPAATVILSQTVDVTVNGDTSVEPNETFFVNLSGQSANATLADPQGLGTLNNDDQVSISIDDVTLAEGNAGPTTFTFTVSIDQSDPANPVTVNWATADGTATTADSDYVSASGTLTFLAGTATLSQTVDVAVNGDTAVEADETFTVDLSGQSANATLADPQGLGTINNDDQVSISIDDVTQVETDSGTTSFGFTVSIDQADPSSNVTVNWATNDGTATTGGTATSVTTDNFDRVTSNNLGTASGGGNWIEVESIAGALKHENNQLRLRSAFTTQVAYGLAYVDRTYANDQYAELIYKFNSANGRSGVAVRIDPAGTATSATLYAAFYERDTATVKLRKYVSQSLDAAGTELGSTTFVPAVGEALRLEASGTSLKVFVAGTERIAVTDPDIATGKSGVASRSHAVDGSIHHLEWDDGDWGDLAVGGDYAAASGSLTFPAGTATLSQPVAITVNGDTAVEPNETFTVDLSNASANAVLTDGQGLGTITNDDSAATPTIEIDHEEGDFTDYDSTVAGGGDLSVTAGASLAGTSYGLDILINDTGAIYGQKNQTAPASNQFRLRLYLDPNSITMASGEVFEFAHALSTGPGGADLFSLRLGENPSANTYGLTTGCWADVGGAGWQSQNISDAEQRVEIHIERAATSSSADGRCRIWVDGTLLITHSGLDNWDQFAGLTSFRFGADSIDAGTTGTFYMDEIVFRDDGTEIGAFTIEIDHEEGDFTDYDSTVNPDGDLSVTTAAALAGTSYGLNILIDDQTAIYGQKNYTAPASNEFRLRAYIDPNGVTIVGSSNDFQLIRAHSTGPLTHVFQLRLEENPAANMYNLVTGCWSDTGQTWLTHPNVSDSEHYVEIHVERAATSISSDGRCRIWIDGILQTAASGVDNYDVFANLDFFWFGAPGSIDVGTSGTVYMDEIVIRGDGNEIGPVTTGPITTEIDHEEGDFTDYDSTVNPDGDLSVTAAAALTGTSNGLNVLIDDTTAIYGQKNYPAPAGNEFRLRFYLDPNAITIPSGQDFHIIRARASAAPGHVFRLLLKENSAANRYSLSLGCSGDASTSWDPHDISDAVHYVEIHVERAATSTSADGRCRIWTDGTLQSTLVVDNYDAFALLESFWFGALAGIDVGTSGTFYLDEIVIRDDGTEIGAAWYNTNWSYRKKITVQAAEVSSDLNGFPVYLNLANLGADFFSHVNGDGGDIRITKFDGTTEQAREVVDLNAGTSSGEVHFKADTLSSSANTDFYIYYGNTGASDYLATDPFGRNNVWDSGYQGVWHMAEASGSRSDATGNGNALTDNNTVVSGSGQLGVAADFDYLNTEYLSRADGGAASSLDIPGDLTFEAWVFVEAATGDSQYVVSKWRGSSGAESPYFMRVRDDPPTTNMRMAFSVSTDGTALTTTNQNGTYGDFTIGGWYHLAVVHDDTANEMRQYVNGSLVAGPTTHTGAGLFDSDGDFYLGSRNGSARFLNGLMDEARISSSVRSVNWLLTQFRNQNAPSSFYSVGAEETAT